MSAESPSITPETALADTHGETAERRPSIDAWLSRFSEYLNPILVKEARQELKSRQFSLTFTLLLVGGWLWSIGRITSLSPAIYFAPSGHDMLYGYFLILSVPMLIIIPFSAFRSLALEREDGTFELLSITTLSARQIVTGKLGSAVLQMIVYYSALSPCLAFTYLLRGIDIPTILFVMIWTFLISIALSILGLLCATITRAKHWQSVLAVLVILGLGWTTLMWNITVFGLVFENGVLPFDNLNFMLAMAALVTFLVSFSVLFLLAAASRISFASDNASTRLRATMLVQQVLLCGWMIYFTNAINSHESILFCVTLAGCYWAIAGAIMCGESSNLSPRVRRQLPQSFVERLFLTWFYPGSGSGYFFAVGNLLAVVIVGIVTGLTIGFFSGVANLTTNWNWVWYSGLLWAYVTLYLGVGRILYLLARRFNPESLLLSFVLQVLLALSGMALPWLLQHWASGFEALDYTPLQFTNWIWTLVEIEKNGMSTPALELSSCLVLVFMAAVVAINLLFTAWEVEQVRQETPRRILEDELQLHPEKQQPVPRLSPWDEASR